jgi:protein involved in polysaccharide export with SLBB domain
MPGEMIHLVPTSIADPPDGMMVPIDPAGDVSPLLGIKVHVAGLTPTEAAAAIQKAYQPKYFTHWDFTVTRVQQPAPANAGRPLE